METQQRNALAQVQSSRPFLSRRQVSRSHIAQLSLRQCALFGSSCAALAELLRRAPRLTQLDLSHNRLAETPRARSRMYVCAEIPSSVASSGLTVGSAHATVITVCRPIESGPLCDLLHALAVRGRWSCWHKSLWLHRPQVSRTTAAVRGVLHRMHLRSKTLTSRRTRLLSLRCMSSGQVCAPSVLDSAALVLS